MFIAHQPEKATRRLSVLLALAGACGVAAGQTVTVTTVADLVDFSCAQQVADLPGPDGAVSFREAAIAANNTVGPQRVEFAIPQSERWLYDDRAILELEDGTFVLSDDETTVDFTNQTNFTGDTNPDGWEVGIYDDVEVEATVNDGQILTATTTHLSTGNTPEFSA